MNYFLKYLPVKSNLRPGDMLKVEMTDQPISADNKATHMRLFVCSKDINKGERAYCLSEEAENNVLGLKEGDNGWINPWCIKGECPACIKVIGEVSPDSYPFAKEGMEFKKNLIQVVGHTPQNQIDIQGKATGGRYYFIDTLGTSNEYLIIEDDKFLSATIPKNEK